MTHDPIDSCQAETLAKLSEGLAKVKTQHPQETGRLEVIIVGGIMAPDQVISLDINRGVEEQS